MSFETRLSKRAVHDIERVLKQTLQTFGAIQYERYKLLIKEALVDIASNPLASPAQHRPESHRDARAFHIARRGRHARHILFYRVVGREVVEIGRLLHDAMDFQRHLPKNLKDV
jgi:toxin ParE1/3/4